MNAHASLPKTVAAAMTSAPVVVGPDELLDEAAARMARHEVRHLPVIGPGGEVIGMLSDRDVKLPSRNLAMARVGFAMTALPLAVTPTTSLAEVARILATERVGALPVVDHGELVGIISDVDLLRLWPED